LDELDDDDDEPEEELDDEDDEDEGLESAELEDDELSLLLLSDFPSELDEDEDPSPAAFVSRARFFVP
jgi:hypothetical protein